MDELPVLLDDEEDKTTETQPPVAKAPQVYEKKPRRPRPQKKPKAAEAAAASFDDDKEKSIKELQDIRADKSRAGKVDIDIMDFVNTINQKTDYYTTSSCSGRTIVVNSFVDPSKNKKFNIDWVYITHDMAETQAALDSIQSYQQKRSQAKSQPVTPEEPQAASAAKAEPAEDDDGVDGEEMWFKMEAPIVAIRARNIEAARKLLNTARANGLKNCGIRSINPDNTVMVTLVDTQKIDTLVAQGDKLLIDKTYLNLLVESGNRKLKISRQRFEKLRVFLEKAL